MAKDLFPQIEDGAPLRFFWRREDFRFACCDCLLVHRFDFAAPPGGGATLKITRDERATAQLRRHRDWKWKKQRAR